MRQIKFRGKVKGKCDWVYGSLLIYGDGEYNIHVPRKHNYKLDAWNVTPETVGQFTGLKDCNGKEIYEGDIVSVVSEVERRKCEVEWSEGNVGFFLRHPAGPWYLSGAWVKETAEVIGNIFDNPKLIKNL